MLLVTTVCSGQVLVSGADTIACYNKQELRVIAKAVLKGKECDTLRTICEHQLSLKDSTIIEQSIIINDQRKIIANLNEIVWIKDNQIKNLVAENKDLHRQIKRQKVYKWVAIIGGGALSGYLGFKYLTK